MTTTKKINDILRSERDLREIQRWLFSLLPLGVAFAFFFVFMLPLEIEKKDVILIVGGAAGFAGLEAYWVYRGWQRSEGITILLGLIGICVTALLVWGYIYHFGDVFREIHERWPR
jgi:hypothetical protein